MPTPHNHLNPVSPSRDRRMRFILCALLAMGLSAAARAQNPDFIFFPVGPTNGNAVDFFPTAGGVNPVCDWDFGDPVNNPPVHDTSCSQQAATYQSLGIFVVTLTVTPGGSITKEVGVLTDPASQSALTPEFTPSTSTPVVGQAVTFTDNTAPANSVGHWIWDFGDTSPKSYLHRPSHTFQSVGTFTVTLTVENNATGEPGPTVSHVINVTLPITDTPTLTVTQTPTETPTPTLTRTVTPTGLPTGTPTQTTTPGPPGTPTQTATAGVPETPTITSTGTLTPSLGPNLTSTRTKTPTRTPVQGPLTLVGYIPVVGSTPGNFGSFFKTSVQLLNPGSSSSSGRLVFHPAGVIGAPTNPSLSWSLAPGQTIAYDDVVAAMSQTGLGSMDVYVAKGAPVPVVLTRVFDDAGAAGTSGFTEPFYRTSDIPSNGSGFLIGPSDIARFRYNIGVRTLDSDVSVTATVRNSAGAVVHSVTNAYPRNTFLQTSAASFLGFSLANNQSIQIAFTGGGLIAYGATVDNVTNDPSAQFLAYGVSTQTADAAPRGRPTSTTPLLFAAVLALLGTAVGAAVVQQ